MIIHYYYYNLFITHINSYSKMSKTTFSNFSLSSLTTMFLILSFLSLPNSITASSIINSYLYGGCTQQRYTPNSPYESNLDSLLTSLVNSATYMSYNNFTIIGSAQQDVIYGLYQCRGDLSMPDCATCVARAVTRAGDMCPGACGGAVQLDGCYVKYDNATFLGVEQKDVVLKKCGPSVGYNPEGMGSRDAVLAGLAGSSGPFREGGSGEVRGVAQCTEDLSFGECQDCLSEAISKLKSDCGTADYGDMFLAKCYARYSIGGAHQASKAHGKSGYGSERTFAMIIGLLAGVAILIIFLAFLTKICRRQGK